jgi:serine/threonine-protein kinase
MPHAHNHSHPRENLMNELKETLRGTRIGEYVIEERIGSGGMGYVYRAVQPLIGKQVAIKVLRHQLGESPEDLQRLLTEARAVNSIHHRGIIDIFSFGTLPDGRQYIVMELLRGHSLEEELARRGRLPAHEVLALLEEILSTLTAAHGAGVIHRDIKPSNVFLVEQPDGTRYVKLLDFGLAKLLQPYADTPETQSGHMLGTPGYMAPEQIRGRGVTPAVDLYALGVVAFQLLTGQPPFPGTEPYAVVMRQMEEEPPVPSSLEPSVSPALDAFILQLLARKPEHRPASAEAVRQQLGPLRASLSPTVTPAPRPRLPAPRELAALARRAPMLQKLAAHAHRVPRKARVAAGALLLGLVALGVGVRAGRSDSAPPTPAEVAAAPPAAAPLPRVISTPPAPARPAIVPAHARSTPPELVAPSAAQLVEATHQLERRLLRSKLRGEKRTLARDMLLDARQEARAAGLEAKPSEQRLWKIHYYLKAWEQKFLPPP